MITPGQIGAMARTVFSENGYTLVKNAYTSLVFEKQASKMNNIAYGDWTAGEKLWVRVKLDIRPLSETTYLVQAQAFYVRDKGEALEDEIKAGNRKNYQRLLDEVAQRLKPRQ